MDGGECYEGTTCDTNGLEFPYFEYPHEDPEDGSMFGQAIIGGHVYRGERFPQLAGSYLFADIIGPIWQIDFNQETLEFESIDFLIDLGQNIVSIDQGADSELYFLSFRTNEIFELVEKTYVDLIIGGALLVAVLSVLIWKREVILEKFRKNEQN